MFPRRKALKAFVADKKTTDDPVHAKHLTKFALENDVRLSTVEKRIAKAGVTLVHTFQFRYAREDGQYREITVSKSTEAEARELADRRLSEQYGDACLAAERQIADAQAEQGVPVENRHVSAAAQLLRDNPALHQDNYTLASVKQF